MIKTVINALLILGSVAMLVGFGICLASVFYTEFKVGFVMHISGTLLCVIALYLSIWFRRDADGY